MNQILSTNMPMDKKKKVNKNKQPIAIENILKFFGIAILVFGIVMAGKGVYAIYQNQSEQKEQNLEPIISIENKTDTTILLKVTHHKNISKLEYSWNDGASTAVNGHGQYLEQEIKIPSGNNTLHVLVQDENGKEITYDKQYEIESNINFEVSGNKIRITYERDTLISYMTYRWDDEEESTIQINDTIIDKEIDAIKGLHTLTVVVVDENNNTDIKEQKINGVSKPKLEIGIDDTREHFVIKTSDDEMLARVEFILNQQGETYVLNLEDKNMKELNYVLPMSFQAGDNVIEVKVYNSDGILKESAARFVKR